jgi:sporulation related protein
MSNHPYGLRGDPFAPPATLSPKDASKLIRRRVRAFNGDGGALFPIDACDLIHELTGGIPDAILALAGKAMRVAAAEGASSVSPSHVRRASETAPDVALVEPASAVVAAPQAPTDHETARAVRAIDALIEAAEEAVRDDATIIPYHDIAGVEAQAADTDEDDTVPATAHSGQAGAVASIEDDDLPPFIPASIALPTEPSENLDPGAREWVSRFIGASGAGPVTGEASTAHASIPHEAASVRASTRSARPTPATADASPLPVAVQAPPGPRRRPRAPAPRRRRRSSNQGLLVAVAAVCVIAFVVRMSLRGNLVPPGAGPARSTPTSALAVEPGASATRTAVGEPEPAAAPSREASVDREHAPEVPPVEHKQIVPAPTSTSEPAHPRTGLTPASASGNVPAPVESARRPAPATTFGLEVATFIFEERARVERERLAAAGLRARVVTTLEYGSRVYRVVLSGFPDPAAAERAADSLLLNGVVLQARVIRVPSEP